MTNGKRHADRDPKTGRFQQGVSGNPAGRPAGAFNAKTIVTKIANERHQVTEGGKRLKRSSVELVLLALRNCALSGDVQALKKYSQLAEKYGGSPSGRKTGGFLVVPAQYNFGTTPLPVEDVEEDEI